MELNRAKWIGRTALPKSVDHSHLCVWKV